MDRCPGRADQPGRSVRREGRSRCVLSARLVRPGRRSHLRRLATHRLPGGLAIYPPSGHDPLTTVTSRSHADGARAACPHPAGVCLADRLDFPRRSLLVLTCPGGLHQKTHACSRLSSSGQWWCVMNAAGGVLRWSTALTVVGVAAIAAVWSYEHASALVRAHGESSWTGRLIPLTVDGLIYASSMVMWDSARRGLGCPR